MGEVNFYVPTADDKRKYASMSLCILTPCKDGEVPVKFAKCVANLIAYSWMHGLKIYQMGFTERTVVHWARNELGKACLEMVNEYTGEPFTHMLWLDDDSIFNPDLAVYLARHGDLDMVSAVYYARVGKHLPVVYVKDTTDDVYRHFPLVEVPQQLVEVDACGFGALLMRRDVLQKFPHPWFRFNECGEDIYFCVHAKLAGARVWVDGSYMIGHLGEPTVVSHQTYRQFMRDNEELLRDRIKVPLGGAVQWQNQSGPPAS